MKNPPVLYKLASDLRPGDILYHNRPILKVAVKFHGDFMSGLGNFTSSNGERWEYLFITVTLGNSSVFSNSESFTFGYMDTINYRVPCQTGVPLEKIKYKGWLTDIDIPKEWDNMSWKKDLEEKNKIMRSAIGLLGRM